MHTIIMSSSFRLVYWIGLDLIGPSSQSSKHLCIFGLYGAVYVFKKNILRGLGLVGLALYLVD